MEPAKKQRHSAIKKPGGKPAIRLEPTPKILQILDLLQTGPLPSHFIKTWTETDWDFRQRPMVHTYTDVLLPKMDDAHLIRMPESAKIHNVRNRPFVYENADLGKLLLVDKELWRPWDGNTAQFKHNNLLAMSAFSFKIAPRQFAGLELLTEADLLARPQCPQATRAAKFPSHFEVGNATVKPDHPMFALGYTAPTGGKAFLYFNGLEIDLGTEQNKDAPNRKTITTMIRNYARYYEEGVPEHRYGLKKKPVYTPIITTKADRMRNMMEIVASEVHPRYQPFFIFKRQPDFKEPFPEPTGHMVAEPWARVGAQPLYLLETLKATAERMSA